MSLLPGLQGSALDWEVGDGFRSAPCELSRPGRTGFTLMVLDQTFTNVLAPARHITNQIHLNGSGVAMGDADGDGWCDVFLCGLGGGSALFRNLGQWRFQDVTAESGVACRDLDATGAVFADLDGDADLDLVVNSVGGGTRLFFNKGGGRFEQGAMLNPGTCGTTAALADTDGDGDLDLYIANYRTTTLRDMPFTKFHVNKVEGQYRITTVNNRPVTEPDLVGRFELSPRGKVVEYGEPDVFYRNDGSGRFRLVPFTDGVFLDAAGQPLRGPLYDWGLSAMFRDLNDDGQPDLYVCNDFSPPDRIWINDGRGRFQPLPALAMRTTPMFSMGIDVADIDRDGHDDVFVSDMVSRFHRVRMRQVGDVMPTFLEVGQIDDRPQYSHNCLSLNRGDGTYAEIARFSGVYASEWTWCPAFLDVDLDGYEDLLVTTGHERDSMNADVATRLDAARAGRNLSPKEVVELNRMYPRLAIRSVAFRNRGDLTFEETTEAWRYGEPGVHQGQAMADLDNDGDLDIVMNALNGPAAFLRNDTVAPRIAVRLRGLPPNTSGIGAKVRLTGGLVPQSQEMICGGRYLSADDAIRVFAAGGTNNSLTLEVRWRSGRTSVIRGVRANRIYEINEGSATKPGGASAAPSGPPAKEVAVPSALFVEPDVSFVDETSRLNHTHHEEPFDDYARQPLLPRKLSQSGPGVSWCDVNGDGWDDLVIGSGRGGRLACYTNNTLGGFSPWTNPPFDTSVTRDQAAILGLAWRPGFLSLLVGSANYEDGLTSGGAVLDYDLLGATVREAVAGNEGSVGPLAAADYDGDGDLDLLVGGRCVGGRYPAPSPSRLFRMEDGIWTLDAENTQRLSAANMVTGAVWSDLDADGWPDLVLACDWGPIRVIMNERGRLSDRTVEWGLSQWTGWWTGVTTGDLDGDGRMDIVAGNWGLNTHYRASAAHPQRLWFGDMNGAGGIEIVEAGFDEQSGKDVPERGYKAIRSAMPWVQERARSFDEYGLASVETLLGDRSKSAAVVSATTLSSMIFLNRGTRFEARSLPREAQLAPAFGVCVADLDGDGMEDVILSQNFFAVNPDDWRLDAGRGLWLKGDGKGGLGAVPGQRSGIQVYGEQRGCALADYDRDGRVDVAITQNGNATRLFRNAKAKPGLRVRLVGPEGNSRGVGCALRLGAAGQWGPAREVHGGSGYWSQDAAVQVMCLAEEPEDLQLQVRWPGGKVVQAGVPRRAQEVELNEDGALRLLR